MVLQARNRRSGKPQSLPLPREHVAICAFPTSGLQGLRHGTLKRYLLVGNPTAQSGKNAARIERALYFLAREGTPCTFLHTLPGGGTIGATREVLDRGQHDVVIAMGGDGTFREVASALVDSTRREQVAMAMLPTGTANDQGRSFGLSASPDALEDNLRVAAAGHETRLDGAELVTMTDAGETLFRGYFFDSATWGISARILARRNVDRALVEKVPIVREIWRDQAVYAAAALRTFLTSYVVPDKFTLWAVIDGRKRAFARLSDFLLKGTRIYAGAWVVDRTSQHDDGYFEAVPFRGKRDWTSKVIVDLDGNPLNEERLNTLGVEHSKPFRFQTMDLAFESPEGGEPLAAQMDGDEIPAGPRATVRVLPRVIRLIVPPGGA
jgi:diacylglycerol kinase family enzyme